MFKIYRSFTPRFDAVFGGINESVVEFYAECCKRLFPNLAATFNGRLEKAVKIAWKPVIERLDGYPDHVFLVQSESNPLGHYVVNMKEKTCTCPGFGWLQSHYLPPFCKHRLAVALRLYGPDWKQYAVEMQSLRLHKLAKAYKDAYKEADRLNELWLEAGNRDANFPLLDIMRQEAIDAADHASALHQEWNNAAALQPFDFIYSQEDNKS